MRSKRGFTLIELIITMVILGIVAYISTEIVLRVYKGYNQANAIAKANLKVDIALSSIANRLEYAIDGTIVKRKSETESLLIAPINEAPADYKILEWIGYAVDSFIADESTDIPKPAWSGICDIKNSTSTEIKAVGSNLAFADDIIKRLSNNSASLGSGTVAIFFPANYEYNNIGYALMPTDGIRKIVGYNPDSETLTLDSPIKRITEVYRLAWSAYAIVPTECGDNGCKLVLRYNFRPWNREDFTSDKALANSKVLATNVTVFKTYATANRVHIKLCVKEKFMLTKSVSICKEKVIFK